MLSPQFSFPESTSNTCPSVKYRPVSKGKIQMTPTIVMAAKRTVPRNTKAMTDRIFPSFLPCSILETAEEMAKKISGITTVNSRFRSEEHTSELQSRENLVCRLLLEKKKNYNS